MQQSEAFHGQLRASYAAIVAESFEKARHCLSLARLAQESGDCAEVRRWIWCVRVLRMAAAEWRNRASRIAPALVCLLWLVGCVARPAPVKVSATVTVPTDLLRLTCERFHPTKDAHWDGVADLLWSADGRVIGVHCSYTTMEAGLATVAIDVDIRTPLARELRAYVTEAIERARLKTGSTKPLGSPIWP